MRSWKSLLVVGVLFLFACSGGRKSKKDEVDEMAPEPIVNPASGGTPTGGLISEKGDISGDGKPDVWNFYKETRDPKDPNAVQRVLVKKEADLNFDGKKDISREFDAEGVLVREEADLDFDGLIDQANLYDKGVLTEKHVFRGTEGKIFMWKYYEEGKMVRMNRDENQDGRPDYCELWYVGEKLSKKGWDKTGKGECDYWENAE
jgi:hypothetical protein